MQLQEKITRPTMEPCFRVFNVFLVVFFLSHVCLTNATNAQLPGFGADIVEENNILGDYIMLDFGWVSVLVSEGVVFKPVIPKSHRLIHLDNVFCDVKGKSAKQKMMETIRDLSAAGLNWMAIKNETHGLSPTEINSILGMEKKEPSGKNNQVQTNPSDTTGQELKKPSVTNNLVQTKLSDSTRQGPIKPSGTKEQAQIQPSVPNNKAQTKLSSSTGQRQIKISGTEDQAQSGVFSNGVKIINDVCSYVADSIPHLFKFWGRKSYREKLV